MREFPEVEISACIVGALNIRFKKGNEIIREDEDNTTLYCDPMQKWLQGFAYRDGIHWWFLAATALGAIIIAFVTISFQSFKAASANPVDSLRSE